MEKQLSEHPCNECGAMAVIQTHGYHPEWPECDPELLYEECQKCGHIEDHMIEESPFDEPPRPGGVTRSVNPSRLRQQPHATLESEAP